MDLTHITTWAAAVPLLIAGLTMAAGLRPWKADTTAESRGGWVAALSVTLAYAAGNWGLTGGLGSGDALNHRLLLLALVAGAVGVVDGLWRQPAWLRWLVRVAASAAAGGWVVGALVDPQAWSTLQTVAVVALLTAAGVLAWTTLDLLAAREPGPALVLGTIVIAAGGSGVVVLSGLISTGQVAGALVAALGGLFLASWRFPAAGRLRSAAPVVALLLVGHWATGLFYAEMPWSSFSLLSLAPLALLVVRLPLVARATAVLALTARLVAVGAPVGAAVVTAAVPYFGADAATSAGVPKADEAYDPYY